MCSITTAARLTERQTNLANSASLHGLGLHLGEVVIVRDNISNDRLLIRVFNRNICVLHRQVVNKNEACKQILMDIGHTRPGR